MRTRTLVALAALAVTAAGCDLATGTEDGLAPAEMVELSNAMIQEGLAETADTSVVSADMDSGLALDVVTASTEFTVTRECPLGGEVIMTGTRERTRDTETRTGTMDVSATRTFVDCARPLRDSVTVTLNGAVTFTAHREWQEGTWHGVQELSLVGSVDWATDDDRSGTCEIDVQASFDPETRTRTVEGSICGEDVDTLQGWSFGTGQHGPGYRHGNHQGGHHGNG